MSYSYPVPDEDGQFCSSSSSPQDSVRELDDVPLRLRTSMFPRRFRELVEENCMADAAVAVEYVLKLF